MGKYLTTNKGKPLLSFKNFYYVLHKDTYWRCRKYSSGCKGLLAGPCLLCTPCCPIKLPNLIKNCRILLCSTQKTLQTKSLAKRTRQTRYVALGNRLLQLVRNYDSTHEVLDFLKGVAHNMSDDSNRWKSLKKRKNEDLDEVVSRKKNKNLNANDFFLNYNFFAQII